jgi:hypothetical protein
MPKLGKACEIARRKIMSTATQNGSSVRVEFGNGRYSAVMSELFTDIQRLFNITPEKAEKVARQFGSDFGAHMANQSVAIKFGKRVSDDGKLTLAESCKVKNVTATNAIMIARAADWINSCKEFAISKTDTQWALKAELAQWIEEL